MELISIPIALFVGASSNDQSTPPTPTSPATPTTLTTESNSKTSSTPTSNIHKIPPITPETPNILHTTASAISSIYHYYFSNTVPIVSFQCSLLQLLPPPPLSGNHRQISKQTKQTTDLTITQANIKIYQHKIISLFLLRKATPFIIIILICNVLLFVRRMK